MGSHTYEITFLGKIQAMQLRHADLVLCAGERQRLELRQALGGAGRTLDPVVIPFGIAPAPPRSGRRPLREQFPQIGAGDTVVIWWGSLWRWLDAETAIRAFAELAGSRPDLKLVVTAGRHPGKEVDRFDATEEMRELARSLGVLDRTVLFLDTWIRYEERHDYLREADLGLTLHRNAEEARLAARARYMDYLSAELPCILGRGDETAEEFGRAGFAQLVEEPEPGELAAALLELADDPAALQAARDAGARLAGEHSWEAVGTRLRETVATAIGGERSQPRASAAILSGAAGYYARELAARIAAAGPAAGKSAVGPLID